MSDNASNLVLREEWRRCRQCRQPRPPHEFIVADTCLTCWLEAHTDADGDDAEAALALLAERVNLGLTLGNGRNVHYPVDLDYRFRRLLDCLRHYMILVRITLAADRYHLPAGGEVIEGHLRRRGPVDGIEGVPSPYSDALALFRNPCDGVPTRSFVWFEGDAQNDLMRIVRVEVIDPVLLGPHDPVVFWQASEDQKSLWKIKRQDSLRRETRRAKRVLAYLVVVFIGFVAMIIPAVRAYMAGSFWWAWTETVIATVVGMVAAIFATLIEDEPDLSLLWRRPSNDV